MKTYVAIDIGGTMIKYGLINQKGNLFERKEMPTEAEKGGTGIMIKIKKIINEFQTNHTLSGICLSSAGMVDPVKGQIFFSGPAIPNYAGTQFKKILEDQYKIPCEIENDVNCAGLAEVVSGSAKGSKFTLCLTIGTGIGGCILAESEIFHGYTNSACEVGYIPMEDTQFQQLASTTALIREVVSAHGDEQHEWSGYRVFEEAKNGNQHCINAIDRMTDYLGQGIATICYVVNPQTVVLGGGIMGQSDYLKDRIETAVAKYLLPNLSNKLTLTFANHENNAGMLGAFYHFMNCHPNE